MQAFSLLWLNLLLLLLLDLGKRLFLHVFRRLISLFGLKSDLFLVFLFHGLLFWEHKGLASSMLSVLLQDSSLYLRPLVFLLLNFAFIELLVIVFSIYPSPEFGKNLKTELIKSFFKVDGLFVDLWPDSVVDFAIVPAKLNLIQNFLHELVLPIVVLPTNEVQVSGFLYNQFVILEPQSCMVLMLPLWGTGFRKAADSSIIRSPWMIFTTFLLSSLSMGVIPFSENILRNNVRFNISNKDSELEISK